MALTRKFLASKGIEADVIDEIIAAHTETVSGLKDKLDEAEKYKAKAEKYDEAQKKLDTLKEEVTKNGDYEALKKEYEAFKADVENKAVRSKKEEAYKEILKDAGIPEKHFAKILKYSDVDGVEIGKDGKIKTAKELLESIKEEWGDHIETNVQNGVNTPNPPKNTGGSKMSKEEIMKIKDSSERQKAIVENRELFGF